MSKRCQHCHPNNSQPCNAALERVNARLADKRLDEDNAPGCPWAINDSKYQNCFWNLAKDLEGDPRTDKEICQLLNISAATLEKTWNSILTKLRARQHEPDVQEWIELLKDKIDSKSIDDTIYLPSEFKELGNEARDDEELDPDAKLAKEIEELEDQKEKRKRRLKNSGMPVHRSGTKIDIYFSTKKKSKDGKKK